MSWFTKIAQQQLFPFMPNTEEPVNYVHDVFPEYVEDYFDEELLEAYLDNNQNPEPLLDKHNIQYDIHTFPTGKQAMTIELSDDPSKWYVVEKENNTYSYYRDAYDWVRDKVSNSFEYFDEEEDFWKGIGPGAIVYHATEEENAESILQNGLEARDQTRGIANRSTGPAVMASWQTEATSSYGDHIFAINLGQMKQDGYMPNVQQEDPISEAEAEQALARGIGIKDHDVDVESGIDPDTVVIFGDIPPKYLELFE